MSKPIQHNPIKKESEINMEEQMLDAFELFRYSFNFRDQLFVVALEDNSSLQKILTDLQVIQSSQIFILVVVAHNDETFSKVIEARRDGLLIEYIRQNVDETFSREKLKTIRSEYVSHDIVVVGLNSLDRKIEITDVLTESLEIAGLCNSRKFFFVNKSGGCTIKGKTYYHLSFDGLKDAVAGDDQITPDPVLLNTIIEKTPSPRLEVVLIDDAPGAIFQEIFTHQGRGTLVTDEYPNLIRWGEPKDIFSISRLMKPYVERGIILPINEAEIKNEINNFLLYTINEAIVAGARMYHYEDTAELAKFFCLPRFRRRGHAKSLALSFIEKAKEMDKKYIFSLSVSEGMWEFLRSLNFVEVDRESLPASWKNKYDFNRSSKAFKLDLK